MIGKPGQKTEVNHRAAQLHPEDDSEHRSQAIKAVFAAVIAAILAILTVPKVMDYVDRGDPIDYGTRPLVIMSVPSDMEVRGIYYKWSTTKDDDLRFEFYPTADFDLDREVPITAVFVAPGISSQDLTCDEVGQTRSGLLSEQPSSVQNAALIDKASTGVSGTGALADTEVSKATAVTHVVNMKPIKFLDNFIDKGFDSKKGICTLSKSLAWKQSGPTSSVLAPQVELVREDWDAGANSNMSLSGEILLLPTPGTVVSESYPSLVPNGLSMIAFIESFNYGEGQMTWSAQPTIIITSRSTSKSDNILFLLAGISFGIIGALIIYALDIFYEVTLGRQIKRRRNTRPFPT